MENSNHNKAGMDEKSSLPVVQFNTKCTACGLCKPSCPAYNVLLDEAVSPRGKVVLMKRNVLSNHLYLCTLCKACEVFCTIPGVGVVDNVLKAREEMVKSGKETEAGKRMIENIRTHGFAVMRPDRFDKVEIFGC